MDSLLIEHVLSPATAPSGLILIQGSCHAPAWPVVNHLIHKQSISPIAFDEFKASGKTSSAVLLTDLTEALFKCSPEVVYQYLANTSSPVYVHLQTDILDPLVIAALEYLAVASLRMLAPDTLGLVWRKAGGKLVKESISFTVDPSTFSATAFQLAKKAATLSTEPPKASASPASSFNLSISEEQRRVKDALVLPYTRLTLDDNHDQRTSGKPILAPDFDDEDPDDDLEI